MYAIWKGLPDHPVSILPKVEVNLNLNVSRVVQRPHRVEKEWSGVQKKRIRVRRADGSFYITDAYPMDEKDFEELIDE